MKNEDKIIAQVIDYKDTFSTEKGKRVLWDMIQASGMLKPHYSGDPNEVVFREGARSIVVRILNLLGTNPAKLHDFIEKRREDMDYVD